MSVFIDCENIKKNAACNSITYTGRKLEKSIIAISRELRIHR